MNPNLAEHHVPAHRDGPDIKVMWTDIRAAYPPGAHQPPFTLRSDRFQARRDDAPAPAGLPPGGIAKPRACLEHIVARLDFGRLDHWRVIR